MLLAILQAGFIKPKIYNRQEFLIPDDCSIIKDMRIVADIAFTSEDPS